MHSISFKGAVSPNATCLVWTALNWQGFEAGCEWSGTVSCSAIRRTVCESFASTS